MYYNYIDKFSVAIYNGRMGRKKLSQTEKLGVKVQVRLRPSERRLIETVARASGKTTSAWTRSVLLKAAERKKR